MKYIVVALSVLVLSSCAIFAPKNKTKVEQKPALVLTNTIDSVSYAIGVNVGTVFKQQMLQFPGGDYDVTILAEAFSVALKGDTTLLSYDQANAFLDAYLSKIQEAETQKSKSEGETFLAENKKREGVVTLPSGLQYQIVKQGDGPKPKETDKVKVHYEGFLLNGKKFDSSLDRGEPISFPLNQVIQGWTEGLQLMPVGSKYTLYIPYQLAYGEQGAGQFIPPFATLIFEVELLGIE
ncbi:MAG TPA: FKBP-type peptidyl-prolyl cis-trans isomerase [Paludibacteraceae bacterium]|nr:FKBP-type peptidyl-prolyl cis-trans isomerase [Paludibacteraceae bacterium]